MSQPEIDAGGSVAAAPKGNPARRALLLDAAQKVIEQKNLVDITVDDIVQEAGVARGTFYIYFKDKYDVLAALSRRVNDELFDQSHLQLDRSTPPFDRVRASLRTVLDTWTQHAGLFRSMTQMSLSRPDFLALNQELRMPFIQQIRRDLDRSVARGHAHPMDSAVAAKALAAMMDWLCLLWFGLGEEPYENASAELDHVADELARLWYRAVYASDPPDACAPIDSLA